MRTAPVGADYISARAGLRSAKASMKMQLPYGRHLNAPLHPISQLQPDPYRIR